jgi:RES domain
MNLANVAVLSACPVASVWYRAIPPGFLSTALSYSHAHRYASRYYQGPTAPVQFNILYLAENQEVALFEAEALFGSPLIPGGVIANPAKSLLVINAQVQLTRVADLTDILGSHQPLSTTAQELTGDWEGYQQRSAMTSIKAPVGASPTQQLGAALYANASYEGFLTISSKMPCQKVIGVFPDRIAKGNFVKYSYQDLAGRRQDLQIP